MNKYARAGLVVAGAATLPGLACELDAGSEGTNIPPQTIEVSSIPGGFVDVDDFIESEWLNYVGEYEQSQVAGKMQEWFGYGVGAGTQLACGFGQVAFEEAREAINPTVEQRGAMALGIEVAGRALNIEFDCDDVEVYREYRAQHSAHIEPGLLGEPIPHIFEPTS